MDNAVIVYCSFTGNTEEVAELISDTLKKEFIEVDMYSIGSGFIPELNAYDICFIGLFTWEEGSVPDLVYDYLDYNDLPSNLAVFGTGDTQFGGDALFCRAVDIVSTRCRAKYIPLKIEQSPRGSQESKVRRWTEQIIKLNEGDSKIE